MKHQRSLISTALAAIVLVSLYTVCVSSTSVSAADGSSSRATVQPSAALVGATTDPRIAGMIGAMNKANIYSTTNALQRIPTRSYGTAGNGQAAGYLYSKLTDIPGLKVAYQGGSYRNIIATLPGTGTSSKEIVTVGAHYDSISSDPAKAPGATDNACGVAIVLELARVMSHYQFNHTIAFALWNDEEQGRSGSIAYVGAAATSSQKIPLYINYDSSCYNPTGRFVLDIMYNSQSAWAAQMMSKDNTLYGIGFTLTYNVHTCGSDYKSFWEHGYPAVMTHEETHGPAHTPSDTIDQVSTIYALKNGQLGMAVLAQVAEVRTVKNPTTTTLSASTTTPAVGQSVTFTVTLKSGTTPLSKPVHLWCTFNGVRYERGTANIVNGVYKFTGPFSAKGQVIYHADFKGDSQYAASSGTVTVNVI